MNFKREGMVVFLIAFCSLLPFLARDFSTRGEPREALVVASMLNQHEFVLPTVYGGDIPSKPPFLHWCGIVTSFFFGDSYQEGFTKVIPTELSVRLPSLIAASLFAAFFFLLLKHVVTKREALLTVLILTTLPEWLRSAIEVRVDMVFATTLAGALFIEFGRLSRVRAVPRWWGWLALSAAFFAKGPIAVILFSGIVGLYALLIERIALQSIIKELCLSVLPSLVLPSLWYLAAYKTHPDLFAQKVLYENFARFSSTMEDEPHKHNIFYLIAVFLVGTLPWIGAVAAKGWKKISFPPTKLQSFCIITIVIVFGFFAIPSSKRGVYLLPMYPALAVLLAAMLAEYRGLSDKWLSIARMVVAAVTLITAVFLKQPWIIAISIIGAAYVTMYSSRTLEQTLARTIITFLFIIGAVGGVASVAYMHSLSPRAFSSQIASLIDPREKLYSFKYEFYSVAFYTERQIWRFDDKDPAQRGVVLVNNRDREWFLNSVKALSLKTEELFSSERPVIQKGNIVTAYRISS